MACNRNDFGNIPGTCAIISGPPHNDHESCIIDADPSNKKCASYCDGVTPGECKSRIDEVCKPQICTDDSGMILPSTVSTYTCNAEAKCVETSVTCGGFKCDVDATCKPKCTKDDECLKGYSCENGQCNAQAPVCGDNANGVPNGAVVSAADPDMIIEECAPYHCVAGACSKVCDTAYDCIPSADPNVTIICNDSRVCVDLKQEQSGEDSGSCSTTPSHESSRFGWLAALAIAGAFAARRRRASA